MIIIKKPSWGRLLNIVPPSIQIDDPRTFLADRVQQVVLLISLYFLSQALVGNGLEFAKLSRSELLSYVLGAHILRSWFRRGSGMAFNWEQEKQLILQPWLDYGRDLFRSFQRESIKKIPSLLSSLFEIGVLILFVSPVLVFPKGWGVWFFLSVSLFLSLALIFCLEYIVSLSRIIFRQIPEFEGTTFGIFFFLSGAVFPLTILSSFWQKLIFSTPFPSLVHGPLHIFLERSGSISMIGVQLFWIIVSLVSIRTVVKRWSPDIVRPVYL